tara:strand:- start:8976 stop:10007 length:1032 start_codon:yes stop_codon:yes gene_type:complete
MSLINFEPIEYNQLSRFQKIAIFFIVIGPDMSSQLLSQFDNEEIEIICKEIANAKIVDHEIQRKVIEEFSEIIGDSMASSLGGSNFARKALELAQGDYQANTILERIEPSKDTAQIIEEIGEMAPRQIFNLMCNEQPQTIAFLVAYLTPEKATEVVSMLNPELREEVLEKMGSMEGVSVSLVQKVVQSLKAHSSTEDSANKQERGGVRFVADIMNILDKDLGKEILANLEEKNPTLGAAIRKKMFSFDDLVRLSISDMQRIAREVEMSDLVVAMKSASNALKETIFSSVSKRAAETLKDELDMLGPVKLKDVEAAQDRIIQVVRKLDEEGEITLDPGEDSVIE